MHDLNVAVFNPSEHRKSLPKRHQASLYFRVVLGERMQEHDAPHPLWLLRARRNRPRRRRAAEQDEVAARDHSITSSARASSVGGTSRPSALAVLRLMRSSILLACCTGKSAGFSPLRIRPV